MVPVQVFAKTAQEMLGTYGEFPKDAARTQKISKLLNQGSPTYPVFIADADPDNFIMEGRHRIVAFWKAQMPRIPVFYVSLDKIS